MKLERGKNSSRNIIFGAILKIYQIVMPFIVRTVLLYWIGAEYLGLNSLFTSILQVLNLAELGVGGALLYAMYRPIAEDNEEYICALMNFYRKVYRVIGSIVLLLGLLIVPFLKNLVNKDLPEGVNLYVLYGLNLASTVVTYWLFAYKNSIISAHQREDINSKIILITESVKYALQIAVIWLTKQYYLFVIVSLLMQIIQNVVTAIVAGKMFPQYKPRGYLERSDISNITRNVRDIFTARLGGVISGSADTLVISSFLGLVVLAVYQNYYFIITSVLGFVTMILDSCSVGFGNCFINESEQKNFKIFRAITMMIVWIDGWCTMCLYCLFQPFMLVWVGKDYLLENGIVVCLCIYFFVYVLTKMLCTFKDSAGIWHRDRFRPLIVSCVNLFLNLVTVRYMGLYGVVLSTALSFSFIGIPWLFVNIFTTLFRHANLAEYFKYFFRWLLIIFFSAIPTIWLCQRIPDIGIITFVLKLLICLIIPNIINLFFFRRYQEFAYICSILENSMPGKMKQIFSKINYRKQEDDSY